MPNSKQAAKRLRQDEKRTARNLGKKRHIKFLSRMASKEIEQGNRDKAWEFIYKFQKAVDKAAKHNGFLHQNTAARMKSRMMAQFNKLKK